MRLRTILLFVTIGGFAIAAALGITAVLAWSIGPAEERLITTSLLFGVFSLTALLCLLVHGRATSPLIMTIGAVASALALAIWLILIWGPVFVGTTGDMLMERITKPGVAATAVAVWAAHFGLLMLLRLEGDISRGLRTGTIAVTSVCTLAVVICFWGEIADENIGRLVAVLVILAVCGTIVTPTVAFIEAVRRRANPDALDQGVPVELRCPRCREEQTLKPGPRRCVKCGLRLAIAVEEPRCRCGYLLYHLDGDECPECGRAVTAEERWAR